MMKSMFLLFWLCLSAVTVSAPQQTLQGEMHPVLQIEHAYIRAMPPGQIVSAAYMQIRNASEQDIELLGGEGEGGLRVEVHTHELEGGIMRMRKLSALKLPAKKSVELKPGGIHLMVFGIRKPLREGDHASIRLRFADGREQSLMLPVKSLLNPSAHRHE